MFQFKHTRTKLITAYVSVFMIVIIVFTGILYPLMRKTIEEDVYDTLSLELELIKTGIKSSLETSIKSYFRASAYIGLDLAKSYYDRVNESEMSEEALKEQFYDELSRLKIGKSGYYVAVDKNNTVLSHPFNEIVGLDVSEYEFTKNFILQDEVYFTYKWKNPEDIEAQDKAMYSLYFEPWDIYVQATGYEGDFRNLVHIEDLEDSLLSIRFGEDGYPVIHDTEGTLLIHPEYKGVNMLERDGVMGDVMRNTIEKRVGQTGYLWKNPGESTYRKKIAAFSEIEGFDMIVVVTAYESEFLQPLYDLTKILMITLFISIIVVILLTIKISDSLTKPIREINELMEIAEAGDLSVRCDIHSPDEIGLIGLHFNQFLNSLEIKQKNLIHQLERNKEISSELQVSLENLEDAQDKLIEQERFSNVGRMVTRVSHHLNTPVGNALMAHSFLERNITTITSSVQSEMSRNYVESELLENLDESSLSIKRALDSISHIINSFNMLNVDLHAGRKYEVDVKEFLQIRFYAKWLKRLPEYIELEVDCEEDVHYESYPNILETVLDHLTQNSITHGFKDKKSGLIKVSAYVSKGHVVIVYEDNGVGIPKDRSEYVFEPFFNTNDNLNSLGIGLNIVYNAVRVSMEGDIQFENNKPNGVKFTIFL